MKKQTIVEMNATETVIFILVLCWITAAFFVPLPPVNSLGM
ncbi:MAG: hypothetical protein U0X40_11590 [Ferruginibacter sp.]